jgi:hypothetical protein
VGDRVRPTGSENFEGATHEQEIGIVIDAGNRLGIRAERQQQW